MLFIFKSPAYSWKASACNYPDTFKLSSQLDIQILKDYLSPPVTLLCRKMLYLLMLHITVTIIRQCKSNLSVVEFSVPCHNHTGCAAIVIGKDKIMGTWLFCHSSTFLSWWQEETFSGRKKKRRQAISNWASERLYKKSGLGSYSFYIQENIKKVSMWQPQLLSFSSAQ